MEIRIVDRSFRSSFKVGREKSTLAAALRPFRRVVRHGGGAPLRVPPPASRGGRRARDPRGTRPSGGSRARAKEERGARDLRTSARVPIVGGAPRRLEGEGTAFGGCKRETRAGRRAWGAAAGSAGARGRRIRLPRSRRIRCTSSTERTPRVTTRTWTSRCVRCAKRLGGVSSHPRVGLEVRAAGSPPRAIVSRVSTPASRDRTDRDAPPHPSSARVLLPAPRSSPRARVADRDISKIHSPRRKPPRSTSVTWRIPRTS